MKFEEAFDKMWDKLPKNTKAQGDKNYPKLLTMMWTMFAIVQKECPEKRLDDIAFITDNQDVGSIPLYEEEKKSNTQAQKSKKDTSSKDSNKIDEEDVNDGTNSE